MDVKTVMIISAVLESVDVEEDPAIINLFTIARQ